MLSSVSARVLLTQLPLRRQSLTPRIYNLAFVTCATGFGAYNFKSTNLEGASIAAVGNYTSLVVPTLEAGVRAMRLIITAIQIVVDYEMAKVMGKLFPENDSAKSQWKAEKARRREELEDAQVAYTSHTPDHVVANSGLSRQEYIRRQKEAVHRAAALLAEAENELASLDDKDCVHHKAANRLLQLCRNNGGVYIKIGQHLANLDYLIPEEYVKVLSSLFDDAPQCSFSDVCQVIQEELGKHPDELFDSFEQLPIASASLAQVHVAYLKGSRRKLAIKVQHRGLRETSSGDIFALTVVVKALERTFAEFTWGWLADEIAPHLPKELDFLNEGRNAERAEKFLKASGLDCVVPRVLWEHTSRRVLCMEFEEGFKATDLEAIKKAGLNKRDIATLISSVFSYQVFTAGSPIHVDPHPANVLIRARNGKPQMVLVDHGLYKDVDDDFRIRYAKLWQSLMLADLKGIQKACASLGVEKMHTLLAAMLTSRPYDEIMERAKSGSLSFKIDDMNSDKAMISGYAQHFFKDIIAILGTLPRQMLLLLKMNDCLRHIDHVLGSPANTLVITGRYACLAVHRDIASSNVSFLERLSSLLSFMSVLLRIQAHEFALWWMETRVWNRQRIA